jgi:CBS domain-containing protein
MDTRPVKEVMLPLDQYATTRCDATLRDALLALSKAQLGLTNTRHHHRAVLVLDDRGQVVGKLTHWSILKSLQPSAISIDERDKLTRTGLSQDFIDTLGRQHPFQGSIQQMLAIASRTRVCDAMVPVVESIDEDAEMCHAIAEMVRLHIQSILVTRDHAVVGILRLSDVFEQVADVIRNHPAVA